MAAVAVGKSKMMDMGELYRRVEKDLPFYARPVFIRVARELAITGNDDSDKLESHSQLFPMRT